jgi:hypothetical protein
MDEFDGAKGRLQGLSHANTAQYIRKTVGIAVIGQWPVMTSVMQYRLGGIWVSGSGSGPNEGTTRRRSQVQDEQGARDLLHPFPPSSTVPGFPRRWLVFASTIVWSLFFAFLLVSAYVLVVWSLLEPLGCISNALYLIVWGWYFKLEYPLAAENPSRLFQTRALMELSSPVTLEYVC